MIFEEPPSKLNEITLERLVRGRPSFSKWVHDAERRVWVEKVYITSMWKWAFMGIKPEGRVKRAVIKLLHNYTGKGLYFTMPVPSGYGKPQLDFVGCWQGFYFSIETKAPGKPMTQQQYDLSQAIMDAGGMFFFIDGEEETNLAKLKFWLEATKNGRSHKRI